LATITSIFLCFCVCLIYVTQSTSSAFSNRTQKHGKWSFWSNIRIHRACCRQTRPKADDFLRRVYGPSPTAPSGGFACIAFCAFNFSTVTSSCPASLSTKSLKKENIFPNVDSGKFEVCVLCELAFDDSKNVRTCATAPSEVVLHALSRHTQRTNTHTHPVKCVFDLLLSPVQHVGGVHEIRNVCVQSALLDARVVWVGQC